jgi:plasmid stabilization system protein ParE
VKVRFLSSAVQDLDWFKAYYSSHFPQGARSAAARLQKARALLESHPMIGKAGKFQGTRELFISKTPFKFVYRVRKDWIEILRVWDTRADDPDFWLNEE